MVLIPAAAAVNRNPHARNNAVAVSPSPPSNIRQKRERGESKKGNPKILNTLPLFLSSVLQRYNKQNGSLAKNENLATNAGRNSLQGARDKSAPSARNPHFPLFPFFRPPVLSLFLLFRRGNRTFCLWRRLCCGEGGGGGGPGLISLPHASLFPPRLEEGRERKFYFPICFFQFYFPSFSPWQRRRRRRRRQIELNNPPSPLPSTVERMEAEDEENKKKLFKNSPLALFSLSLCLSLSLSPPLLCL